MTQHCSDPGDLVELRKKREFLVQLTWPGELVVHINPENKVEPVKVEAQVKP